MTTNLNKVRTSSIDTKSTSDIAYFALIVLIWTKDVLLTYVRAAIMRLPLIGRYPDIFLSAIWAICIFFAIPKIAKKINTKQVLFVITAVAVYFSHYLLFPDNGDVLSKILPTFMLSALPLYFIGISIDVNKYFKYMYTLSLLSVLGMSIYKTVIKTPMTDIVSLYQGDMDAAYKILPHVCIVIYGTISKPNIGNIAVFAVGFILMFSLGCRGALGCMIAFLLIMVIWFQKRKHRIISYAFMLTGGVLIVTFFYDIMLYLGHLAQNLGLSIRIFDKFFSGELFESVARTKILETIREAIFASPFIGNGIAADRVLIKNGYAHNIAYEFWLSFGLIVGTILLAVVILRIIRSYTLLSENTEKMFLIIFIFSGFIHLFL